MTIYHISQRTAQQIQEELGHDFCLVSHKVFEAEGSNRVRYTVTKLRGVKFITLIGYEDGTIKKV